MKNSFLSKLCCCSEKNQSLNDDKSSEVQQVVTVSRPSNDAQTNGNNRQENPAHIKNESQTMEEIDSSSVNGHKRLTQKISTSSTKSIDSFKSVRSTFTVKGEDGDYYSVCSEDSFKSA